MFLINLNAEIVAYILSLRKSRHKPNLENTSKYGFSPDLGEKNGGVLSMRMQVILDSSFARPGSAPIWGGKKGEFRDWTTKDPDLLALPAIFSSVISSFFTQNRGGGEGAGPPGPSPRSATGELVSSAVSFPANQQLHRFCFLSHKTNETTWGVFSPLILLS